MAELYKPYLFGIDLDGTLLNPSGAVSDRTKNAVHALLHAGHKVAFATGRNYIEARGIFDIMEHQDLAVLVSGAVVVDTRSKQTIHCETMDPTLAGELCAAIERLGHAAVALQNRQHTGRDYVVSADPQLHDALGSWLALSDQVLTTSANLSDEDHTHTFRVSTVLEYAEAAKLKLAIEKQFAGRAYVHGIIVASEGVEIIEMFDRHVNKWLGLSRVADLHGVPHERIVAIGDDMNDIAMIRNSPFGTAMGNARTEVKEVAKQVIGSNIDDGLAVFLEDWLQSW